MAAEDFIGYPTSGPVPLTVQFINQSFNSTRDWTSTPTRDGYTNYFLGSHISDDGSKVMLMESGYKIYDSTNYGQTWSDSTSPVTTNVKENVRICGSSDSSKIYMNTFVLNQSDYIYDSTNNGRNWAQTAAPSKRWISVACSSDASTVYASAQFDGVYVDENSGNKIYKSIDGGLNWFNIWNTSVNHGKLCCSSDASKVFIIEGPINANAIYRSTDSGTTFSPCSDTRTWIKMSMSADASNILASEGGIDGTPATVGVYYSNNSGTDWTKTSLPEFADYYSYIYVEPRGVAMYALTPGTDRTGYISMDKGATWSLFSSPGGAIVGSAYDDKILLSAYMDSSVYISFSDSTYLWNFGDGTNSTLNSPSHTYTAVATRDVSLTVTH